MGGENHMSKKEEYLFRAIIRYLNKDYKESRKWTSLAAKEQKEEKIRNMLHATVDEVLRAKGCEKIGYESLL